MENIFAMEQAIWSVLKYRTLEGVFNNVSRRPRIRESPQGQYSHPERHGKYTRAF